MTKFHVTLGKGKKGNAGTSGSRLKARAGGVLKTSSGGRWTHDKFEELERVPAGRRGGAKSLDDRWTHDKFEELERAPAGRRGGGKVKLAATDLRWRLSGGPKIKGQGNIQSRLGGQGGSRAVKRKGVADAGVAALLASLGLEKYKTLFTREEVDVDALACMDESDLQALGIPMGPRKKLLSALQ